MGELRTIRRFLCSLAETRQDAIADTIKAKGKKRKAWIGEVWARITKAVRL